MIKEKLQRPLLEERKVLLNEAESLAQMGSWKWIESRNQLVWSAGLYKIFEKKQEDVISWDTFLEKVFPDDSLLVEEFLHEVKINKAGSTIDYRIIKDGAIHYLSLTAKAPTISNIDILGAVVDITKRKEYEKQLEQHALYQSLIIKELDEKEKKYRILFERSIDPIFLATENLTLTDINNSFRNFLSYPIMEVTSITMESIFAKTEDYIYLKNTLKDVHQIKDFEVSLITKTGEKKICLLNCVFIPDQAAGLCCYQGIIHDLSVRKQAESDMLNAERFALTGKIARTIAHEVRNPLTNLTLALEQLREEIPSDNESANLYGDIIERNTIRIERLIDEMLNSSKPRKLELARVNAVEMINETISLAIDRIKLREIHLVFTCQKELRPILVDKEQVQIALLNIIINAAEAMMPKKGILKIGAFQEDEFLKVSVSDNGKGIPANDLGKLFDPFFTNKPGGKGLGLTSTKNILNSHNAQIEVKSELDKGTTFNMYFRFTE